MNPLFVVSLLLLLSVCEGIGWLAEPIPRLGTPVDSRHQSSSAPCGRSGLYPRNPDFNQNPNAEQIAPEQYYEMGVRVPIRWKLQNWPTKGSDGCNCVNISLAYGSWRGNDALGPGRPRVYLGSFPANESLPMDQVEEPLIVDGEEGAEPAEPVEPEFYGAYVVIPPGEPGPATLQWTYTDLRGKNYYNCAYVRLQPAPGQSFDGETCLNGLIKCMFNFNSATRISLSVFVGAFVMLLAFFKY